MIDVKLLPSQRAQLFEAVKQAGFDPAEFRLDDTEVSRYPADLIVTTIVHQRSGYWLKFEITSLGRRMGDTRCVTYSPGHSSPEEKIITVDWPAQLHAVETYWLPVLRRELEAPDLWGMIARQREEERQLAYVTSSEEFGSTLTAAEAQEATALLTRIEQRLIEQEHLEGQRAEFVKTEFTYLRKKLEDANNKISRKDLVLLTIATALNICTTLKFPGPTVADLYYTVVAGFQQIFLHLLQAVPPWLLSGGPGA